MDRPIQIRKEEPEVHMKSGPINQWEENQLRDETTVGPSMWKSTPPYLLTHWMRRNCARMIHTYIQSLL